MNPSQYHELMERYLEEDLMPSERNALVSILEESPEYVKEFKEQILLSEALSQSFNPTRSRDSFVKSVSTRLRADEDGAEFVESLLEKIDSENSVGFWNFLSSWRELLRRRHFALGMAAASLILLLSLWLFLRPSTDDKSSYLAKVETISKDVSVVRDGKTLVATKSMPLVKGDELETLEGAIATIGYEGEDTVISVHSKSRLKLRNAELAAVKQIQLLRGGLTAKVANQEGDKAFVVTTEHAEIRVMGTKFDVLTDEKLTTLKVVEGEVSMEGSDHKAVSVKAGYMAVAGDDGLTDPVFINGDKELSKEILFFRDFEKILPGEKSPNELVVLKEPGGEVTAIESKPVKGGSPTFRPDVELRLWKLQSENVKWLYTVPKNVEIRIRIKSEQPGKWVITQMPTHKRFQAEHFNTEQFDVDSEWKEVVLRSSDIKPYMNQGPSRDFIPGVEIDSIAIFGFGTGKMYLDRFAVISTQVDSTPAVQSKSE